MSESMWLKEAWHRDLMSLNHHNGTFSRFLGVVLHVNVSGYTGQGTSPDWYAAGGGPDCVCPNFQVMRDGTIWQFLPMNVQPWTQADGNFNYASIETGGMPDQPLTQAQLESCATIIRAYHDRMGMPLVEANAPGQRGFGIHSMGGEAWGGHSCPGTIRANQRPKILALASGKDDDMTKDELIEALNSAEGQRAIYRAVLNLDAFPNPSGDNLKANPTWAVESVLTYLYRNAKTAAMQKAPSAADIAKAVVSALPPAQKGSLTDADIEKAAEAAIRKVFADAGNS